MALTVTEGTVAVAGLHFSGGNYLVTDVRLAMARGFAEQSEGRLQIESAPPGKAPPSHCGFLSLRRRRLRRSHPTKRLRTRDERFCWSPMMIESTARLSLASWRLLVTQSFPDQMASRPWHSWMRVRQWNLIITDISMPGMDGLFAASRSATAPTETTAILLTGFATNAVGVAVGSAPSGGFTLPRQPVTTQQLAERIGMLLEGEDA